MPSIPLLDVVGRGFNIVPEQTGFGVLKVGVTIGDITISIDLVSVHPLMSDIITV